ncbi:MAG TPA: hypothetical protein VGB94_13155 [Acidobacteriaceae bacterium]
MRRFVTLALILIFSIPVGISISGCAKKDTVDYCNGGSSGMVVGQITQINLEPRLYGISLNYGNIGQISSPSAVDCKGNSVGVVRYTYGTTDITYADISPSGAICAGTWNRNTAGGVSDYTTCTPPSTSIPIPSSTPTFSVPTVPYTVPSSSPAVVIGATSTLSFPAGTYSINGTIAIQIAGGPVLTGTISNTTGATAFAAAFNGITAFSNAGVQANLGDVSGNVVVITGPASMSATLSFTAISPTGFKTSLTGSGYAPVAYLTASAGGAVSNPVPIYVHPKVSNVQLLNNLTTCQSQGQTINLTATVVDASGNDITALTGPLTYTPQDSSVVSINSTVLPPVATAQLPGSTILTASTSNASSSGNTSSTGIWYTCPPKSITLAAAGTSSTNITLNQNNPLALTATVTDTTGLPITGLNLEYISTSPRTLSANGSTITATYPGSGAITAICQPPSCNNAPLSALGQLGNGLPITSNPIQVTTPGTVNTVLVMASTHSQYFSSVDFLTGLVGSPVRLPYVPNSMVSDEAGTTMYMGTPSELMVVSLLTNSVSKEDASVKGTVVGVANDGSALVMSDSVHNTIYVYYTSSGSSFPFGGTATHAVFSPDNSTIYITGSDSNGNNFFVYSTYNSWHPYKLATAPKDVIVSVPSIAAFLAGSSVAGTNTSERSYCAVGVPPTDYFPEVSTPQIALTDRLAVTNDSLHLFGAAVTGTTFTDFPLTSSTGTSNPGDCPTFFNLSAPYTLPLGVAPATITGVIPEANSALAFVTYTTIGTTTTGTKLPVYKPSVGGVGTMSAVTLLSGATAPVSGIFSPDGLTFYTGTSGDNLVHLINVPTLTDTKTLNPSLYFCTVEDAVGNCTTTAATFATPDLLANRPRPTT